MKLQDTNFVQGKNWRFKMICFVTQNTKRKNNVKTDGDKRDTKLEDQDSGSEEQKVWKAECKS